MQNRWEATSVAVNDETWESATVQRPVPMAVAEKGLTLIFL
jgi:hypothetical protein